MRRCTGVKLATRPAIVTTKHRQIRPKEYVMSYNRSLGPLGAGALVVILASCGGATAGDELVTVNVAYSVSSALSAAPFAVATENGYFNDHGCQLGDQIEEALGGSNTLRSVIDGGLDMGEVATNAVIEAGLSGTPITIVGTNDHIAPHDMVYGIRKGEAIEGVEDLAGGGRLGFTNPGSATEDMAHLLLDAVGLTPDDVELVPTSGLGGGVALLEGGDVD